MDAFPAEKGDNVVDHPVGEAGEINEKPHHDDHGDEVGEVGHSLHRLFEPPGAQFVEQQRKQQGGGEGKHQGVYAQDHRVPEGAEKVGVPEQPGKVLEAYPGAPQKAQAGAVILKGDNQAVNGKIAEDDEGGKPRNGQNP